MYLWKSFGQSSNPPNFIYRTKNVYDLKSTKPLPTFHCLRICIWNIVFVYKVIEIWNAVFTIRTNFVENLLFIVTGVAKYTLVTNDTNAMFVY